MGLGVVLLTQCKSPSTNENQDETMENKPMAFELSNIDSSIAPCDNFYKYAIGNWQKENEIPGTEGRWMSFDVLAKDNEAKIQEILDESLNAENPEKGSNIQLIKDFYLSALDTNGRNAASFKALMPFLDEIDAVEDYASLQKTMAKLKRYRVGSPVGFYVGVDDMNSDEHIVSASQGGLTLGDKSYYLKDGEKYVSIREKYVEHVNKIFSMATIDEQNAGERILAMETKIAQISWDRKDLRDADKTYNKMTVEKFDSDLDNIDVASILSEMGLSAAEELVVGPVSFYTELDALFPTISVADWKSYMKWHLFSAYGNHIDDKFQKASFEFFSKEIRGIEEMRPRQERILKTVNGSLGEPLGKLFVEKHFPKESKDYMVELIENLRSAYARSIQGLTWMGDSTKEKAMKKLKSFTYKIGYPDKWKDYSQVDISADNYLQNIINLGVWRYDYMVNKLGKPVDRDEWYMTPQMVNAYYSRANNEIVFPAGILQPPFFHPTFDHAIHYGGIGAVIGHEFSHGFDDQGAKYDWDGNKNNWWTKEDEERFKELTSKLAEQYSTYEVLPGEFVNGELTLGENIADLGGLTLAYMALEDVMKNEEDPMVDGFTWQQRFFLGWANVWKGNIRDEALRNRILTDPHSPGEQRVIGPLVNLLQFDEAFGCAGTKMSKSDTARIKIW